MTDTRELWYKNYQLGSYEVAAAMYSDGDVLQCINNEKKGILIADTCGHEVICGAKAERFLNQLIRQGWGGKQSAEEELIALGKALYLAGTGQYEKEIRCFDMKGSDILNWWDFIHFHYAQIHNKQLSISSSHSKIVTKKGIIRPAEHIKQPLIPYDCFNYTTQQVFHYTMQSEDVLFLSSDGLEDNIDRTIHFSADPQRYIDSVLSQYRLCSAKVIREKIVEELSSFFLPTDRAGKYDDVTFAVVKAL